MIRFDQKVGPFSSNEVIFNEPWITYLQLGIEKVQCPSLQQYDNNLDTYSQFLIQYQENNGNKRVPFWREFIITTQDIFELKLIAEQVKILLLNKIDDPYTIINVAYETAN